MNLKNPPEAAAIEHFVITPFCIRDPKELREARGGGWQSEQDPLEPDFLEGRLKLLEIMASAAVAGQSRRDFSWVLIVDPQLGPGYRRRLRELCGDGVRFIIHDYNTTERFDATEWLRRYVDGSPDFLITTHLDDDDSFPQDYIAELREAARRFITAEEQPLVRTFGSKKIWMWHMIHTRGAPLGVRSEWSGSARVTGCGFSLFSKYPEVPVSVLALRHRRAENYLAVSVAPEDDGVARFRMRLAEIFSQHGVSLESQAAALAFEDISERTGHVVVANHPRNIRGHRLFKKRIAPARVAGPETFPGHAIDWDAAERYLPKFRLPFREMVRLRILRLGAMVKTIFDRAGANSHDIL